MLYFSLPFITVSFHKLFEMSNLKVVVVCVLFAISYSEGYMRSIASQQNKMEISGSSDEERGLSEKKLGSSDEIQAPIDDEVFHQTALASLTNDGADLTRVTLCDPQHAVAIAHYVDQFQENCESLKVVVTGVPGSGYSHIHDVEKVTAEPKSDNYIRKEDDYRVAVITLSSKINETMIFSLEMPTFELKEDGVEKYFQSVGWLVNKERRKYFHKKAYTIGKERIYATFPNCASEINDNYIGGFIEYDTLMIATASSVEINHDNSVKVYFIAIYPKRTFIEYVQSSC